MSTIDSLQRLIATSATLFVSRTKSYRYRITASPKNPRDRKGSITATGFTLAGTINKLAKLL